MTTEYLKVPPNWFTGKICLDAGCGSNANGTHAMLSMGAEKVYAFDLDPGAGDTILESVPPFLQGFEGKYELSLDNVLDMDFPDGFFDYTHCAGVLHHTGDVLQGLRELARVTKQDGTLYVLVNGVGGLARDFTELLRQKYQDDGEIKALIDDLDADTLASAARWMLSEMTSYGDGIGEQIPESLISQMFDRDLVLTIKDRILSPVYHQIPEQELVTWLKDHGFTNVTRLARYPTYRNIRRFLSPFYNVHDHWLARLVFGEGAMGFKATKKAG